MYTHINDVLVCKRLMRLIVLCVLKKNLVHVRGCVLIQLVGGAEDDECDLTVTQNAELICLLHYAELALVERDLEVGKMLSMSDFSHHVAVSDIFPLFRYLSCSLFESLCVSKEEKVYSFPAQKLNITKMFALSKT